MTPCIIYHVGTSSVLNSLYGSSRVKLKSTHRGEEGMATTPVFLPAESHEQRGLGGYSP